MKRLVMCERKFSETTFGNMIVCPLCFRYSQVIHGCPEPVGSVCVPEISLRTYSVKRFANRFLHIPTRLDWKSTEFRRNFPLSFRLESVGKEMVGIRRNRQESTKNASDPTQLLTDPAIGMLDLGSSHSFVFSLRRCSEFVQLACYTWLFLSSFSNSVDNEHAQYLHAVLLDPKITSPSSVDE